MVQGPQHPVGNTVILINDRLHIHAVWNILGRLYNHHITRKKIYLVQANRRRLCLHCFAVCRTVSLIGRQEIRVTKFRTDLSMNLTLGGLRLSGAGGRTTDRLVDDRSASWAAATFTIWLLSLSSKYLSNGRKGELWILLLFLLCNCILFGFAFPNNYRQKPCVPHGSAATRITQEDNVRT